MHRAAAGNAPHRLARHALMSASALALTAILSAQPARAADECGAEGAGADTVTCTGAGFANGITYAGSDGLSLVLNNANMVVTKGAASDGVNLSGTTANDLTVTAASLSSIDGGTGSAITVNNGGDGKAAVVLNTGTVTTNFFNQGAVQAIHNSGAGDSVITMNGGSVTNSNAVTNFDLYALVGGTGTGNATVLMTGGSLQGTATFGLRAAITNTAAAGTASITMDAGTITSGAGALATNSGSGLARVIVNGGSYSGVGYGARADSSAGTGNAQVSLTGGSITSTGTSFAQPGMTAFTSSGSALATMSGGSISIRASAGYALVATSQTGSATATVTGGTLSATGNTGGGVQANITNAGSATDAMVTFSGASITTTGTNSVGVSAQTLGSGAAKIQLTGGASGTGGTIDAIIGARAQAVGGVAAITMDAGTIRTTGASGFGLSASSTTGDARVTITGGTISTTGNTGHGANAFTASGAGTTTAVMSGGSITTIGQLAVDAGYPASGLISTIDDLAKYATALDHSTLISQAAYDRLTTSRNGHPYGYGWFTQIGAGERLHWVFG